MRRHRRFTGWLCAGLVITAVWAFSAAAAHAVDETHHVDQPSVLTPNGVAVFDARGNPILVPGAGGDPQVSPGIG